MKTLLLIDGSSYLYRAFHGMPDLRSPTGEPNGAIYGMVGMLQRLKKELAFDYCACIFDAKGKTFRDEMYADYKAQRPSMPDDLAKQIPVIHDIVRGMGFPFLQISGVEADDVMGTLAQMGVAAGFKVILSTGDKDMAQLVNPHVSLINTMTNETLDEAGILAKFGVPPNRIVDYLSLIGDKVDNVPGVDKCGPKTALKWLADFDSLDGIIANAHQIGGKVGENLRSVTDWLPKAYQLITIKCDVDLSAEVGETLASLEQLPPHIEILADIYQKVGLKSYYQELTGKPLVLQSPSKPAANLASATHDLFELETDPPPHSAPPEKPAESIARQYETVLTEADLQRWLAQLQHAEQHGILVAVDTETTGLDALNDQLVGISFCMEAGVACYIPLAHCGPDQPQQLDRKATLALLKPWLESALAKKVGHNLKFDRHIFANHGIALAGIVHDTLLAAYVLKSHEKHNLAYLAETQLGVSTVAYESLCGKGAKMIGFEQVDVERAAYYAAEDADLTLRLCAVLLAQMDDTQRRVYETIELPTAQVLFTIERNGVCIDAAALAAQSHDLAVRLLGLESEIYALAGQPFNINSPKQMQTILFEILALPTKGLKKTPTGGYSTDESVLEILAAQHPLPQKILEYRGLAKLKSTYTDKLGVLINPKTGRLHTTYAQSVVITGRLASNNPNLQNIPVRTTEGRKVREAFVTEAGNCLVSADYSQIELRIMAHLSGDATMIQAFERGDDIHQATAAEVFGVPLGEVTADQRRSAKAINFGLIYGMGAYGLARALNISNGAAKDYIERYFARYPNIAHYMEATRVRAKEMGYVETAFGRRLYQLDINSSNAARRAGAERAAINAPMQGTAADLIKLAMIAVQNWIDTQQLKTKLIMQVHDELVLEVPEAELATVQQQLPILMAQVADFKVPLLAEVGTGKNWESAH